MNAAVGSPKNMTPKREITASTAAGSNGCTWTSATAWWVLLPLRPTAAATMASEMS